MITVIKELARFLGISEEEAKRWVTTYHVNMMAEEWADSPHDTAEEVREFYKKTDKYLYELIPWNFSAEFNQRIAPLLHYRRKKILEIGAGIGSLCISLYLVGNDVTYYDINDKLRAFAAQRFTDRLLPIKIATGLRGLRDYDMVVAIDTLEHIHRDDLEPLMKNIAGCLKDGGFLYHRSNWGQQNLFPMHYNHAALLDEIAEKVGLVKQPNGDYVKGAKLEGVQISIPIKAGIDLTELLRDCISMEAPPKTTFATIKDKPADLARNLLVKKLTKDWIFFMDADQRFPSEALKRLISWNVDIVSGLVFKRTGEPIPMFYRYMWEEGKGHYYSPMCMEVGEYLTMHKELLKEALPYVVLPPYALLEIDGCGLGCLLVHRRVFEALEEPYFEYNEGTTAGEDFYFCRKAQDAGFKIYGDPSVICGHFSQYTRSHKHFMAWSMKEDFPWGDES